MLRNKSFNAYFIQWLLRFRPNSTVGYESRTDNEKSSLASFVLSKSRIFRIPLRLVNLASRQKMSQYSIATADSLAGNAVHKLLDYEQ